MFRCYFKYFKNVRKVKLQLSRQKKNVAMYRDIYNYIDINAMISCELKNYRKFLFFRLTEKWLRLKSGIPPDKNDTEQLLQRKCFLSHVLFKVFKNVSRLVVVWKVFKQSTERRGRTSIFMLKNLPTLLFFKSGKESRPSATKRLLSVLYPLESRFKSFRWILTAISNSNVWDEGGGWTAWPKFILLAVIVRLTRFIKSLHRN